MKPAAMWVAAYESARCVMGVAEAMERATRALEAQGIKLSVATRGERVLASVEVHGKVVVEDFETTYLTDTVRLRLSVRALEKVHKTKR